MAALFYSLSVSCRLINVDAQAYLLEATRRVLVDREALLLPEDFAEIQQGSEMISSGS